MVRGNVFGTKVTAGAFFWKKVYQANNVYNSFQTMSRQPCGERYGEIPKHDSVNAVG